MAGGKRITGADVRAKLGHPVVDGDSHIIEYMPLVIDYLKRVGGPRMAERFAAYNRDFPRRFQDVWWSRPSGPHTYDCATAMLPKLLRARLDDIGIDYAVLYSSIGLWAMHIRDDELRQALHRALNTMFSEIFAEVQDRMTVSAVIPTHSPEEAIAELDHAVGALGLKAVTVNSEVRKAVPEVAEGAPHLAHLTETVYSIAFETQYDYDPFWKRCVELGVAPGCHTKSMGGGSNRASRTNFVFNHLGAFAAGSEFLCRSVFMGGVVKRFPGLNFQFLEGNASWALGLYNDICEHWEKRNPTALKRNLDPAIFDYDLMIRCIEKYGDAHLSAARFRAEPNYNPKGLEAPTDDIDEFRPCGIKRLGDIKAVFEKNFFFGCEADDRMASCAFNRALHHGGARLNATLSSDLGHWDVVDMLHVLPEAYAMLEDGLFTPEDFKAFSFANTVRCLGGMNPGFFKGTAVEAEAAKILAEAKAGASVAAE